jgi:hypothetical protein
MKLNYRLVGRMAALFIEAGQDAPKKAQAGGVLLVNTVDNISKALDQIGGKYRCLCIDDYLLLRFGPLPHCASISLWLCLTVPLSHCASISLCSQLLPHQLSVPQLTC